MAKVTNRAVVTKTRPSTKITRLPAKDTDAFFRAESDLHTLQRADEIKTDPKRMRNAKAVAKDQAKRLQKIAK